MHRGFIVLLDGPFAVQVLVQFGCFPDMFAPTKDDTRSAHTEQAGQADSSAISEQDDAGRSEDVSNLMMPSCG